MKTTMRGLSFLARGKAIDKSGYMKQVNNMRSKISGMILGAAIGDALGMPVEGYTAEEASAFFDDQYASDQGIITPVYRANEKHHWFKDRKPGTWTDDTQLTLAVAEGIIEALSHNRIGCEAIMDCIAQAHVDSLERFGNLGLGGTTREAIEALEKGVSWKTSAPVSRKLGYGNGVVMKLSPLAALLTSRKGGGIALVDMLTNMSHKREVSVSASHVMVQALGYCLCANDDNPFSVLEFVKRIVSVSFDGCENVSSRYSSLLVSRIAALANYNAYNEERIIQDFGGGSVSVYDSLPFSLMFFLSDLKDHGHFPIPMNCIRAGGDTDSNGSMVASLYGALYGETVWDKPYIEGLWQKDYILDVINRLCDVLCFNE